MKETKFPADRMSDNMRYIARNVEELKDFNFRKGDIVLVTYPKCGTHWMKYIIWGILHKGEEPPNINDMRYGCLFPELEHSGTAVASLMKSPRTLSTHSSAESFPFNEQAKYIHVTRNPFDCCISFYSFCQDFFPVIFDEVSLDQFVDDFIKGNLLFGDYFQRILDWYQHKDDDNYLHITYEEISKDHRGSILKVAKFLDEDYFRNISNDEELLRKIEYHSSFSFMKSLPKYRAPKLEVLSRNIEWGKKGISADDEKFREIEFFRRGQVGDFKKKLSEEQKQQMRNKMEEKFQDSDLLHLWDEDLRDS